MGIGTRALWRTQVLTRAAELRESAKLAALARELTFGNDGQVQPGSASDAPRLMEIYQHVITAAEAAEAAAKQSAGLWSWWSWLRGSQVEEAWGKLHQGDALLIDLQTDEQLFGGMPGTVGLVQAYLQADNSRRVALEQWWTPFAKAPIPQPAPAVGAAQRELITTTLRAAYAAADSEHSRVRTFRNMLLGTSLAIGMLLVVLGIVGAASPASVSLCVPKPASTTTVLPAATPTMLICPTGERHQDKGPSGGDVFVVELVGLVGAALAGVRALSGSQQATTPYSLAVVQATLKAAAGSTSAVVGVVFLSAGILPALGPIPSQAAILAYAVIFGYAQQIVTGVVDKKADAIQQAASPATPAQPAGSGK